MVLRNDVSVAADTEMWRNTSQKCGREDFAVTETEVMGYLCMRFHPARQERITEVSPPCAQMTKHKTSLSVIILNFTSQLPAQP